MKNRVFESTFDHLAAADETSRLGFAKAIVEQANDSPKLSPMFGEIRSSFTQGYPISAQRPMNLGLATAKLEKYFGLWIPSWDIVL